MLQELLIASRGEVLDRSRTKLAVRAIPTATASELLYGLPVFVDQLIEILGKAKGDRAAGYRSVTESAGLHGGALLELGLSVGQVVQDYGSICQSVTELADERNLRITADEFQTFNHCLDDAIAGAVTAYELERERRAHGAGTEQVASMVHEMRNMVTTSMLTFDALQRGNVGVRGSTSAMLGNTLKRMRVLLDRTLAEIRLGTGKQHRERVSIAGLIEEIEILATMEATERDLRVSIEGGAADVAVDVDRQILVSAVANLVQNAIKFTNPGGHIGIRAHADGTRVLIDVEDQCGGLPPGKAEELFLPFEQRGKNRTGLGLGLSISLKGVRASGGDIHVLDRPGVGCMFTIDLPRAP